MLQSEIYITWQFEKLNYHRDNINFKIVGNNCIYGNYFNLWNIILFDYVNILFKYQNNYQILIKTYIKPQFLFPILGLNEIFFVE